MVLSVTPTVLWGAIPLHGDVSRLLDDSELQSLKSSDGAGVTSPISSSVMAEQLEYFLNREENLRDIYYRRGRGSCLASLPIAFICTYRWEDFPKVGDRVCFDEVVSRAKNGHEETIGLTENNELLTGFEASDYAMHMVCKAPPV